MHVGMMVNITADDISKAASSTEKKFYQVFMIKQQRSNTLKNMLVHFENFMRVIISFLS
jgi:hypothetical protein